MSDDPEMKPKPRRQSSVVALAMLAAVLGPSIPMPEAARRVRPPEPPPPDPEPRMNPETGRGYGATRNAFPQEPPRLDARPLRDLPLYRGPVQTPASPCPDACGTACPHHGKRNAKLARRAERARKAGR